MPNNNELTNEEVLHPTDNEQTTHTMDVLADGGPLEPLAERPDLVQLSEEEIANLPSNLVE